MDGLRFGSDQELLASLQEVGKALANLPWGQSSSVDESWNEFRARADELNASGAMEEFRFSLTSSWSQVLFCALLKRYGIRGYRYRGQKRSTINARVSKRFVDELLWPHYLELASILEPFVAGLAFRAISDAVSPGPFQIEVRPKPSQNASLCPTCAGQLAKDPPTDE